MNQMPYSRRIQRSIRPYGIHDIPHDHLRRMAEPEYLRELRRQAERIEHERKQANRQMFASLEAGRLRKQIRDAGETPCR